MRLTRTIVVGVIAAAVLSGCAIGAAPEPTPSPEQSFALAISDEAVLEALGPLPADEETGHPATTPPISRDQFIATWPFQGWGPIPSKTDMMTVAYDQLNLMCPAVPDAWD